MGAKSRSNYALTGSLTQEEYDNIFRKKYKYICLDCECEFNDPVDGFYYPDYELPMHADVCSNCGSIAYEEIDNE